MSNQIYSNFYDKYPGSFISPHGWGNYRDSETIPSINVTTSYVQLTIDGLGPQTNEDYLPTGVSTLWDIVENKIVANKLGDSYQFRVDMQVTVEVGNPTSLQMVLDVGDQVLPSTILIDAFFPTGKSVPYRIVMTYPLVVLDDFINNGCRIFIKTDTGSLTITERGICIIR